MSSFTRGGVENRGGDLEIRFTFISQASPDAFQVGTRVRFAKRVQLFIDDW